MTLFWPIFGTFWPPFLTCFVHFGLFSSITFETFNFVPFFEMVIFSTFLSFFITFFNFTLDNALKMAFYRFLDVPQKWPFFDVFWRFLTIYWSFSDPLFWPFLLNFTSFLRLFLKVGGIKKGSKRGRFWPILVTFWPPFLTPFCQFHMSFPYFFETCLSKKGSILGHFWPKWPFLGHFWLPSFDPFLVLPGYSLGAFWRPLILGCQKCHFWGSFWTPFFDHPLSLDTWGAGDKLIFLTFSVIKSGDFGCPKNGLNRGIVREMEFHFPKNAKSVKNVTFGGRFWPIFLPSWIWWFHRWGVRGKG